MKKIFLISALILTLGLQAQDKFSNGIKSKKLQSYTSTELTISSGSITYSQMYHTIDTEGDAASDDLDTIVATNAKFGDIVYFQLESTSRVVVFKDGTGNIETGDSDYTLDTAISLPFTYNGTKWVLAGGGAADVTYTANRALVTDGSGAIIVATTTDSEIGYVNGVTSSIQTQLDAKSTASKVETLTNKTIDADGTGNVITNIGNDETKAGIADNKIEQQEISSATYDDIRDWYNNVQSAGVISGGEIINDGDGTITVAAGTGFIKSTNSDIGVNYNFDWAASTSLSLTNDSINYIAVDYNSGTPQLRSDTTSQANGQTIFNLGKAYKEGTTIDFFNSGLRLANLTKRLQQHDVERDGVHMTSGGVVTESGTLNFAMTAGVYWTGHNRSTTWAKDTSKSDDITGGGTGGTVSANNTIVLDSGEGDVTTDYTATQEIIIENSSNSNDGTYHVASSSWDGTNTTVVITETTLTTGADTGNLRPFHFEYYYNDGSWQETESFAVTATQYNDYGTGLAAISNNQYAVTFIWSGPNAALYATYGVDSYTLAEAQALPFPSLIPSHISEMGIPRAKIIVAKDDTSFTEIEMITNKTLSAGNAVNHNDTGNIQLANTAITYGHIDDQTQSIYGVKTFNSFPVGPSAAPTTDYQLANKKYVDDNYDTSAYSTTFTSADGRFTAGVITITHSLGQQNVFLSLKGGSDEDVPIDTLVTYTDTNNLDIDLTGYGTISGTWSLVVSSGVAGSISSGAGIDTTAIHNNVASEITAITEITEITADDESLWEDSSDSNNKKSVKASTVRKYNSLGQLNAQTGTTYTLVIADGEQAKNVTMTNASANTVTIPTNASVAFPVGTVIFITQTGAGTTTVEGDTGVTVNGISAGSADIDDQYKGVFIQKTATDTWIMIGAHGGVS